MKFNLKDYKVYKIRQYFKTNKFFIFYHGVSLSAKNWIKIEQDLSKAKLNYYRSYNSLTKNVIADSIFKNLIQLINGPLFFITLNQKESAGQTLKKLIEINKLLSVLCARLNNKIYSLRQLQNVSTLNYVTSIVKFQSFLKLLLKTPYRKLSAR
jgi:hypothetical protein